MSGGSYNYLDHRAAYGLLAEAPHFGELERMVERLEGLDWAQPAATEARRILDAARQLDQDLTPLEGVFHAIEWWDSCDCPGA